MGKLQNLRNKACNVDKYGFKNYIISVLSTAACFTVIVTV